LSGLPVEQPLFVCNEAHRFIIAEQAREIAVEPLAVILEPVGRNTAPAVAIQALQQADDAVLLVLPADHVITDVAAFHTAVEQAAGLAAQGKLVTFGIVPDVAETGYGYIRRGKAFAEGVFEVGQFVEKPDQASAQQYIESGDYYWNSGMFAFRADVYLRELAAQRPEMITACRSALEQAQADLDFIRLDKDAFAASPSDSIDYAVMEHTEDAVVIPLAAGWSDVGSWTALWQISPQDEAGNALQGDVIAQNSRNCFARSEDRLLALLGVEDLVVIDTKDAVLVASKDHIQDVKGIVDELRAEGRSHTLLHREVYRPWGHYDSIDNGERFQVKRISVKPGEKLSLQMHYHRAEHWIVVQGTARVSRGEETFLLHENESTYIHAGVKHRLENPGKIPLELIEVQSGAYLGEDDIVRFEDIYQRENEQP
jgi:mannose-1-phosphate guanylyltransferase/mannose-6-phosphate isomerase